MTTQRIQAAMLTALLLLGAGCVTREEDPGSYVPSPGPVLVVERFLQAANANDLPTMIQLFGTSDRNIEELDGRSIAERRMYVLATLLRHDDFTVLSQQPQPGRLRTATALQVRLQKGEQTITVPMVVVRRDSGGWIVEQVDVEALTGG